MKIILIIIFLLYYIKNNKSLKMINMNELLKYKYLLEYQEPSLLISKIRKQTITDIIINNKHDEILSINKPLYMYINDEKYVNDRIQNEINDSPLSLQLKDKDPVKLSNIYYTKINKIMLPKIIDTSLDYGTTITFIEKTPLENIMNKENVYNIGIIIIITIFIINYCNKISKTS